MSELDNLGYVKRIDKSNVLSLLENFPRQADQVWRDFSAVKLPASYKKISDIVISGMGGSGLGGHVAQSLFYGELKIPLRVVNSYDIPASVGKNSLCVIISYSGSTEEALAVLKQAKKKKAKIFIITGGGQLARIAKQEKIATYIFNPIHNRHHPRFGLGYTLIAQILLLARLNLISLSPREQKSLNLNLNKFDKWFGLKTQIANNSAKKIALQFYQKSPIIIGSEFLIGSTHVFANQLNETAKTYANYFSLPELNHHLMEGLKFPKNNSQNLACLLINSNLYYKRVSLRYQLTNEVLLKNKIYTLVYQVKSADKITQAFEIIALGSYVSFWLAILNKIDPAQIPWVEYFKKRLT